MWWNGTREVTVNDDSEKVISKKHAVYFPVIRTLGYIYYIFYLN